MTGAGPSGLGLLLRAGGLFAAVLLALWLSTWVRQALDLELVPQNEVLFDRIILISLLSLFVLVALPFLPGAEIGVALLTAFGATLAPVVYLTVVLALMTSFLLGRTVPLTTLARLCDLARLGRASAYLRRLGEVPRDQVLAHVLEGSATGPVRHLLRFRYLLLIVLINMPGNIVIGGGGGIAFAAGVSRCFGILPYCLAIALAVMPLPLATILIAR